MSRDSSRINNMWYLSEWPSKHQESNQLKRWQNCLELRLINPQALKGWPSSQRHLRASGSIQRNSHHLLRSQPDLNHWERHLTKRHPLSESAVEANIHQHQLWRVHQLNNARPPLHLVLGSTSNQRVLRAFPSRVHGERDSRLLQHGNTL